MAKVYEKITVIKLRKQGYTYKKIMKQVPNVAKSTISAWCNNYKFTPSELEKIKDGAQNGRDRARLAAGITNHQNRLQRDKEISEQASKLFEKYKNESLFTLGIALYWGEGAKTQRHFQFTNSDPEMLEVMIIWLGRYLNVDKSDIKPRLYIHKHDNHTIEEYEKYWSKYLGIPKSNFHRTILKKTNYNFNKKDTYKGCIRIEATGGVKSWLTVMTWQKLLVERVKRN